MIEKINFKGSSFKKAEDLEVVIDFAMDDSKESKHRSEQVATILKEMLVLAKKRGRPSRKDEIYEEAA